MNVFYVITNHLKDPDLEKSQLIRDYLVSHGKTCYISDSAMHPQEEGSTKSTRTYRYTDASSIPEDVECVIVLGGDGTLLQASRDLQERDLPLLGVNLGTLGYLAEIEMHNIQEALDRLINDDFTIENRMMLQGSVIRQGRTILSDISLNDIVVVRKGHLRVIDFNIYVDSEYLCGYRADGIIISTPTGSTGYSLSVGGPIVSPDASLILLSAIAPHTLSSRTIVLPDSIQIDVEITGQHCDCAEVVFDGDTTLNVGAGDRISAVISKKRARLIKINNTSFVEILRRKLN